MTFPGIAIKSLLLPPASVCSSIPFPSLGIHSPCFLQPISHLKWLLQSLAYCCMMQAPILWAAQQSCLTCGCYTSKHTRAAAENLQLSMKLAAAIKTPTLLLRRSNILLWPGLLPFPHPEPELRPRFHPIKGPNIRKWTRQLHSTFSWLAVPSLLARSCVHSSSTYLLLAVASFLK